MTKLQKLKKEIQKAVPEIMKWNVGCKVEEIKTKDISTLIRKDNRYQTFDLLVEGNDIVHWYHEKRETLKVLGRPITLEDVLVALKLDVESKSNLKRKYSETTILCLSKKWQLNTPLDQQSEKTIDFLHELLVNR